MMWLEKSSEDLRTLSASPGLWVLPYLQDPNLSQAGVSFLLKVRCS